MTQTKDIRTYAFRNDSAYTVPPFGVMAVTDTIDSQNEITYLLRRPEYQDEQLHDPGRLVINLGEYVAAGQFGRCTSSMPAQALCASGVAVGNVVGPVENSFVMGPLGNAFIIKTKDQTTPHIEGTAETWMVEMYKTEVEIIQITGALDGDGLYPANVVRYDTATATWSTVRACRVKNAN